MFVAQYHIKIFFINCFEGNEMLGPLREFKDTLVQNRYKSYQEQLTQSLYNNCDKLYDELTKIGWGLEQYQQFWKEFPKDHKYKNCHHYHCHIAAYQYHNLSHTNNDNGKTSKTVIVKYDHFKNRILTKKSLIKEHIWYNIKNEESIVISGDYTVEGILYKPITSLFLNGIPVSWIELNEKNQNNGLQKCKLLYFSFDMTSYCDIIDFVLKCFSFLPKELVRLILYYY